MVMVVSIHPLFVCETWLYSVASVTYGYLPSHKASPPIGWYQIILLDDRNAFERLCQGRCPKVMWPGVEPATC